MEANQQTVGASANFLCYIGECAMDFQDSYSEKEARKDSRSVIRGTSAYSIPGINNKRRNNASEGDQ